MHDPLISVVMGLYNGTVYLEETIQSVLAQKLTDFEFIIVNDGSTETAVSNILSGYAREDLRIRVITKQNEGLTRALIDGCAAAKGTYIARIDNGDIMLPDRLQKQSEVLETRQNVVCVSCRTEVYGPEWEYLYIHKEREPAVDSDHYSVTPTAIPIVGITHHGSVMFRRDGYEVVGGYRPEFYYGQDMDLWYRLAGQGSFETVPACLYRVRLFPGSISGQNRVRQEQIGSCAQYAYWHRQRGESEVDALRRAASIRPGLKGERPLRISGAGSHLIAELLRRNGDLRCRRYFRQALRKNPLRITTWIRFMQSLFLRAG